VSSYGESPDVANRRFLQKLREILAEPSPKKSRLRI
jgi:hypothetical protein